MHVQTLIPFFGNGIITIIGSGDLSTDGCGCVGIVAEVGCEEYGIAAGFGLIKAPERRFEAVDNVPASADFIALHAMKSSLTNMCDFFR
tara:strand:- start:723 stop:989 length:267 start_codon:yes stop_codon:yes gene_type:complete